ncbi:c-type cytochrome [Sphingobium aquiterrae]|uniref:c-type cytochrome n=1 Tax=Sphingobium aquiterrae TaxID=2038656 RepID=UPI00301798C8
MRHLILGLSLVTLASGVAFGQMRDAAPQAAPPAPQGAGAASQDDAAAALNASGGGRRGGGNRADATRTFLGLGAAPDPEAAKRGAPIFAENCAACHGPDARGGIGPNLLYSGQVLDDDHGEKLVPFLTAGRPEKGMPPFAQLGDKGLADITEFLHQQVENYANRGTYQNTNNLLVGDAKKGAAYFKATCTSCHSATGDLKGVGAKFRPLDLQRSMIFPSREDHPARMVRATVTTPQGSVEGRVTRIDDFTIALVDAAGLSYAFRRDPDVKVALKDPLQWHKDFSYRLKDNEMTNLVTYLATLK